MFIFFVHYSYSSYIFLGSAMLTTYLGDVSLPVSLDESPLTSSWNASTFTGGTRMPYELLQHGDGGSQGMEQMTNIETEKEVEILTLIVALV